jgi:hypothetical protein
MGTLVLCWPFTHQQTLSNDSRRQGRRFQFILCRSSSGPKSRSIAPHGPGTDGSWYHIIGVVADKRNNGMREPVLPEVYLPYTLSMDVVTQVLVRSDVPPLTLLHAIGKQINSVD